jgi:hypothetical protein
MNESFNLSIVVGGVEGGGIRVALGECRRHCLPGRVLAIGVHLQRQRGPSVRAVLVALGQLGVPAVQLIAQRALAAQRRGADL